MTWFKVDDGFYDHPKVMNLPLAARGLWVTVGSWCAKHETDGEITARQLRQLGGTKRLIEQLVESKMFEICTESDANVYRMCSWSEWNPTSDQLKDKRDAWRESKNTFREQKRREQQKYRSVQAGQGEVSNEVSNGVSNEVSNGVSRTTDPTRPDPTIKDKEIKDTSETSSDTQLQPKPAQNHKRDSYPPEFETWWEIYPRKQDKKKSLTAWKKATKLTTPEHLTQKTAEYANHIKETNTPKNYTPLPTTWLNGERWEDELAPPTTHHREGTNAEQLFIDAMRYQNGTQPAQTSHIIDAEIIEQ